MDVALEDAGVGAFGCDPVVEGTGRPCVGPVPRRKQNVLTPPPPRVQAALESGYPSDARLFLLPDVAYITMRWSFRRYLRHRMWNKGPGGGGGVGGAQGGQGHGNRVQENARPPSLNQLVPGT